MSKAKVLIVEDDNISGLTLRKLLERKGYEITGVVPSGERALKSIEKNMPKIVLMDIWLDGDIDGIEVTKHINDKWDMPVIYITAHTDVPTMVRANQTKHYGYLKKPVDDIDLMITLESVLRKTG
jgi:DNA-binding NtrC family response regulator